MGWRQRRCQLSKLSEHFALFLTQLARRDHVERNQLVSPAVPTKSRNAFSFELEDRAGLRALGNGDLLLAIDGRNFDLIAQGGLGKADGNLAENVVLATPKEGMIFYLKKDVEISRWSAARAGFALVG